MAALLERELGVLPWATRGVEPLNEVKWSVNSAFSIQGAWAFVVEIDADYSIQPEMLGAKAAANVAGISNLLEQIDCLPSRAVLREWQHRRLVGR